MYCNLSGRYNCGTNFYLIVTEMITHSSVYEYVLGCICVTCICVVVYSILRLDEYDFLTIIRNHVNTNYTNVNYTNINYTNPTFFYSIGRRSSEYKALGLCLTWSETEYDYRYVYFANQWISIHSELCIFKYFSWSLNLNKTMAWLGKRMSPLHKFPYFCNLLI